ncbi:putative late blight resistance proteinR1B-8 [Sesamum angolense]|uniref:Late blight resistance proteinR1B-8 n=1 Tax=Sesamum angolense TaxID=2727404 RepID=A0AAE2C1Q1_9LAMI|nr:putative late blight resistance proteinR1B-8 [Sesamum angolense]
MAYNLGSLTRILEQILHPDQQRWILDHNKRPQMESLLEKASSLKHILENSSSASGPSSAASLMSQIRDAAHKAEDIIESHLVDQRLSKPGAQSCIICPPDLQEVIKELHSAIEKLHRIVEHGRDGMRNSSFSDAVSSTPEPDPTSKNTVVGLDEDLIKLKDRLTSSENKLQVIPIIGMGGIGKTTLARNLYNDRLIISHFDTCAWIVISQDYDVRAILLGLLGLIVGKPTDDMLQQKNSQLAVTLYQSLTGRRYLVVLDDMWSTKAWDDVRMFFPDNKNRSRIMLTTRESNVANYVDSSSQYHEMHLLNKFESWNLLHQKVFGGDSCPSEFEKIGRSISSNCRGLPLAIHVIGGLLSEAKGRRDVWEHAADDVRAAIAEKEEQFYNILDKSLEEIAEENLKVLVDRNLLMVREWKSNGKAKTYGIHDLLRDLCMKKAAEDKFLHVKNRQVHNVPEGSSYFPHRNRNLETSNLRYLAFCCNSEYLPSAISRLWNLQTLIVGSSIRWFELPSEIWEMPELRHIKFRNSRISIDREYQIPFVHDKLETISVMDAVIFPPSIIKLTLRSCTITWGFIKTIGSLPNLQVLKMRMCDFKTQEMQPSDQEWEPTEGEFSSLQFLLLEKLNLVHWKVDETHFPRLRHLVIRDCSALEEIPRGVGDIPTLEIIELDECNPCVVASARQIQEEQHKNGNDGLEVRIC